MRILKTIDSSSCQDRKQTVQNLQEDILYNIDSFAATLINPTTDKDLTVFTEHDEEIIKLLPGQKFELVKESVQKTYGKIKVSITNTTETKTVTEAEMETVAIEFITGAAETTKELDLSEHFTAANKPFLFTLYKKLSDTAFEKIIVGTGRGTYPSEEGGAPDTASSLLCVECLVSESLNTFNFSNLTASTTYKLVVIQLNENVEA